MGMANAIEVMAAGGEYFRFWLEPKNNRMWVRVGWEREELNVFFLSEEGMELAAKRLREKWESRECWKR